MRFKTLPRIMERSRRLMMSALRWKKEIIGFLSQWRREVHNHEYHHRIYIFHIGTVRSGYDILRTPWG